LRADEKTGFRVARDALASILAMADYETPSRFLETILSGPIQGRRKLYSRLGMASRDAIDELMNSAIEFERNETASLDRFLSWFSRGTVDVQRDPGQPANEVRVMTVHGAKGLEAPVVILADATADPARLGRTPITLDFELGAAGVVPLIRPKKDERCPPFEEHITAEEKRDLEEHWRLLYVALTRAADRLIVTGAMPKEKEDGSDPRPANCWHRAVEQAMLALDAEPIEHAVWGTALVYGSDVKTAARSTKAKIMPALVTVPGWAREAAPPEARPPRPLAPSSITADDAASAAPSEAMRAAAQRGTWIHQLLERLADVPPNERRERALAWLERSAGVADSSARAEIADQVFGVLSNPAYAPLFGPGSLGEAPLAATLPDGRVIAGTADRLLIENDRVSVLDFKTGKVPPSDSDIPKAHRAQMEAYVEALRVIFPKRDIKAALLYTAGPRLFDLAS
jgi:ATP-dependent helicase/nuclease subunit A